MSPVITYPVGPTTMFAAKPSESEGKRIKAIGRLHYMIADNLDGTKTGHCLDCHRAIDFGSETPWAEMEAEMRRHNEKFCPARIEVGRGK